jgi:hypothetical protein
MIAHLELVIAKMKRETFGPRSERRERLSDQMELQLEELAAAAGEDAAKVEIAGVQVQGFTRRKGTRGNFPDHLPRRRSPRSTPLGSLTNLGRGSTYRRGKSVQTIGTNYYIENWPLLLGREILILTLFTRTVYTNGY